MSMGYLSEAVFVVYRPFNKGPPLRELDRLWFILCAGDYGIEVYRRSPLPSVIN